MRSSIEVLGCVSPVVKVSDHGRHVLSSSPVPLKARRVEERCQELNLSRTQTSPVGVELRNNYYAIPNVKDAELTAVDDLHLLEVRLESVEGLATELLICCEFCGLIQPLLNTRFTNTVVNKKDTKVYEVNTRLAYAMRSVGKGEAAAKVFCGVMNLPPPPKRFYESLHALNNATEKVAKVSMALAAAETLSFNNGNPNVPVAIDGTWQKRGHTSLNGVVTAVSVDTGKVIDAEILSRKCSCHFNGNLHSDECSANYFGNSGEWKLKVHFVSSIAQRYYTI
ncbi:uncharacterized protein TNCV_1764071 [Trichonephila clavipes]|nr:uncharacterized protein TNCV_1764071 [Trichonephila clavipes]